MLKGTTNNHLEIKPGKILLVLVLLFSCQSPQRPFLSNLHATKDTPLYTTYAAAMERSEFVLDEGYEFHFYSPQKGLDFTTDTGGDLCLGFVIDDQWIYLESDMFQPPVITMSYPDLVQYHYYPVEGIRVEASFLVQSSHAALWDIQVKNESEVAYELTVVPFLRNTYRQFFDTDLREPGVVTFTHEEFPDGWTRSHDLPVEDTIRNALAFSEPAPVGEYNAIAGEKASLPFSFDEGKEVHLQVSGRTFIDGERIADRAPVARIQVEVQGDPTMILTENSPVWGMTTPSIDLDGYFRMELGNLTGLKTDDVVQWTMYNDSHHAYDVVSKPVADLSKHNRVDMHLESYDLPDIVQGLQVATQNDTVSLSWNGNSETYRVYRRNYPEPAYQLLTELDHTSFNDVIEAGMTYGYVVTSVKNGRMGMHSGEVTNIPTISFRDRGEKIEATLNHSKVIAFEQEVSLAPGETKSMRLVRKIGRPSKTSVELLSEAKALLEEPLEFYIHSNERLFSQAPDLEFEGKDDKYLYWSSYNMMRQVFLPPEEKSSFNYYVFSREPTWGWGHGGQVFHESIAMLAYAHLDPLSAMNSQRVYAERQYESGYINYRTGSYLDEIIEHNGQLTSSAPWYAWQNWEVYKITKDKAFLEEMYASSKDFYLFFVQNRDFDQDGLCEWGGHAVLESVRDALVAVWDEVGWPTNFEGVDVNSMLVMEAKSLESMARELGLEEEAEQWKVDYEQRSERINATMWDDEDGFYYNVDKNDEDFSFKTPNDLKRQEIIGFLPMWAGVATPEQAEKLVKVLTDEKKFWRKYGVPSLAADDSYYNHKGYWNGPVWVEWNFFIVQALLNYGYEEEARQLVDRLAESMVIQLKTNHNLWEFYSPDEPWGGYHKTYIWAGIINRMMVDVKKNK